MESFDRRNNSEKRNFLRIETEMPVEVQYEGHTINGTCKDLCATGLQVETPIPLALDAEVTVCINTNDEVGKLPPFRVKAIVARLVPNGDSDTTYGLEITEVLQ